MLDVRSALHQNGVETKEKGTNVGRNFINIDCPFCSETRKHCGIHMDRLWFKCFVCGRSGGWRTLVQKLKEVYPGSQWHDVVPEAQSYYIDSEQQQEVIPRRYSDLLKPLSDNHRRWLEGYYGKPHKYKPRNLAASVIEEVTVYSGKGKLANYVVFKEGRNLIARKCGDKPNPQSPRWWKDIPEPPFVYGHQACLQECSKIGVITEGVFDCLRFPYGTAVAILSSAISQAVLSKVCNAFEYAEKIILALDRGVDVNTIEQTRLSLQDLGYQVAVFDWNSFEDETCKDVDDIAYVYGVNYLYDCTGFSMESNRIELI